MGSRKLAQIDFLSGPARTHRRRRCDHADIGMDASEWVGVPAFGASSMEQKIVKFPEHQIVVALRRSQSAVARAVELEQDLAVDQQGKEFEPRKTLLPTEPPDRLRGRQHRERSRNLRIADSKQRAGTRR